MLKHFQSHRIFYSVLAMAAIARLIFLFDFHEIWWDSGVYLGMAKYIWSGGTAGLWEHIRPVLWPLVIGAGWWLNLNAVFFARALEFALALVSILLVYALGRAWFSQRAALFASAAWSFSAISFYLSFHEYTELPAATFALAALLAFSRGRLFWAGLLASVAFLLKFPAGIFLLVLAACLLAQRRWKECIPLSIGFAIPAALFLVFNQFMYGSALKPLVDAQVAIANVLGCNVLRFKPWYQYFGWIVFDNALNLFALVGIGAVGLRWNRRFLPPALAFAIPLLYFMQMHCREYRYLVIFLPFAVLFTGHGLALAVGALERLKPLRRHAWPCALLAVVLVSAFTGLLFYYNNEPRVPDLAAERYFRWLDGRDAYCEVWSANPVVSVYTDEPIRKVYYPIYESGKAVDFNSYLRANKDQISYVFLDNCGGGIICPPGDSRCAEELRAMRSFLNENFRQAFYEQSGNCWYAVYER
jgi:4-amino-4-deoxy-L-arabinose transferase-like glycosyltransferase